MATGKCRRKNPRIFAGKIPVPLRCAWPERELYRLWRFCQLAHTGDEASRRTGPCQAKGNGPGKVEQGRRIREGRSRKVARGRRFKGIGSRNMAQRKSPEPPVCLMASCRTPTRAVVEEGKRGSHRDRVPGTGAGVGPAIWQTAPAVNAGQGRPGGGVRHATNPGAGCTGGARSTRQERLGSDGPRYDRPYFQPPPSTLYSSTRFWRWAARALISDCWAAKCERWASSTSK